MNDNIGEWGVLMVEGRPKLGKLECQVVGSIGEVGEVEGDVDAMTGGLGPMNGGGRGLKRGGKGNWGWCNNGKGGVDGAVQCEAAGLARSVERVEGLVRQEVYLGCKKGGGC